MRLNVRAMILTTGCLLAIGASAAQAQTPPGYYYPAAGNYATTRGAVHIPAAGYYYNVPLSAVPAPSNPTPTQVKGFFSVPAQGSTYSSFYSDVNAPRYAAPAPRYAAPAYATPAPGYGVSEALGRAVVRNKDDLERPDWQFLYSDKWFIRQVA